MTDEAAFVLSIVRRCSTAVHTEATWSVVYTNTGSAFFDMRFWDKREGIAMGKPLGDV